MPMYDFECPICGHIARDVIVRTWISHPRCPKCDETTMDKLPARANFTVGGYNAKNGYSDAKSSD